MNKPDVRNKNKTKKKVYRELVEVYKFFRMYKVTAPIDIIMSPDSEQVWSDNYSY